LTLFARHYAWLHSKPSKQTITRYKQLSSDEFKSPLLEMPKIVLGQYLLDYAFEIGPSKSSGQGPAILDWADIKAWSDLTNATLDLWELLVIREISKAFVSQYYMSEGAIVPAPYQPEDYDKTKVSSRIGGLLRGLAGRKKR